MFERYTEKARRVIFFARYEASQYGSASIDTEHLLLGLLRENHGLERKLLEDFPGKDIREEIEKLIVRRERISTSVEVPLSRESKQVLMFAGEEAGRMGHEFIGTEHLFLGMARMSRGVAATILSTHGMTIEKARGMIKHVTLAGGRVAPTRREPAVAFGASKVLETFLNALRAGMRMESLECLAAEAQYIDPQGRRWLRREILDKNLEQLFGRFMTRNARCISESSVEQTDSLYIANLLWENVSAPDKERDQLRMTVTLVREEGSSSNWLIYSVQTTPVKVNCISEGI